MPLKDTQDDLHPVLGLPYEKWVAFAEQPHTGAVYFKLIPQEHIQLIERLPVEGKAFLAIRRQNWDPESKNHHVFERVVWLRR